MQFRINVEVKHSFYNQELLITERYSVRAHTLALNSAILMSTVQSSLESKV